MSSFSVAVDDRPTLDEALELYRAVGWSAYTKAPETLERALVNSTLLVTARDDSGRLLGLARAVSDDATICYVQDILVRPEAQGSGVGRTLLETVKERFGHVRQTVLITDNEPGQRAFYESLGFTEASDFRPDPLRAFLLVR